MADWEERFTNHPAFQSLADADDAFSAAHARAKDAGSNIVQDHERVGHLLRRIQNELDAVDPLASAQAQLHSIHQNLSKGAQELKNYSANGNHQHLINANTHIENAVVQAGLLPKIREEQDVASLHEAVVSFRRSLGQHISNVDKEAEETREEMTSAREALAELQTAIQQEKARTDEALRRFEAQFSGAEAERRKEAQSALTNLQSQISEVEERFLASQESRQERFTEALEAQTERVKEAAIAIGESQEELEAEYALRVQKHLKDLEDKKRAAEKIVGAVAQTGMVGGYQKIANAEQKTTRVWQIITVLSILGFVGLMLFVVPTPADEALEWSELVGRTLAALGLGGLAAYAGKEASKHAERERHNRRIELEIASVGPFLAELPKEERDEIIKDIADRTFGRGTHPLSVDDAPATTNGLLELLRMTVSELVKRVR